MAALTRRGAVAVGTISGNQWRVSALEVASGVTLRKGSVLVENSGKADLAATNFSANTVLGVAEHAAKQGTDWYLGSTNQEDTGGTYGGDFMGSSDLLGSVEGIAVHYAEANADTIFEFSSEDALALADLGVTVYLVLTSGIFTVHQAAGGDTAFGTIVALPNYPNQAIGDTLARVQLIVLASAGDLY